jgi:CheY-like chemotaxis protein
MQALRFLVVDDATFIRDMMKKQLRDAFPGCSITDAPNALRAQALMRSQRFDLVLCDWEMPEMSGEEYLRWLRGQPEYADLPFIMVTSRGEREYVVKAVQAGVSEYLGKPFKPETLVAKVNKVLGRAVATPAATRSSGATQGIAGASIAVLTGGQAGIAPAAAPTRAAPRRAVARGQAQLNFACGSSVQCVIKDLSLQMLSGVMKREGKIPAVLEQVVISIAGNEGDDVARLNGYIHAVQAGENRIDAAVLKVVIRFVDDDPAKLELLSRYIEKL